MKRKAIIISIKGKKLSKMEKILLSKERPWGIILFKRNLKSFAQIKNLILQIKILTKNNRFPIIIDEEGINVSRLRNIINHNISASFFGNLYKKDKDIIYVDLVLFYTDYFFKSLKSKNKYSIYELIEIRSDVVKNLNDFFQYNLNQNTLLYAINNRLSNG